MWCEGWEKEGWGEKRRNKGKEGRRQKKGKEKEKMKGSKWEVKEVREERMEEKMEVGGRRGNGECWGKVEWRNKEWQGKEQRKRNEWREVKKLGRTWRNEWREKWGWRWGKNRGRRREEKKKWRKWKGKEETGDRENNGERETVKKD